MNDNIKKGLNIFSIIMIPVFVLVAVLAPTVMLGEGKTFLVDSVAITLWPLLFIALISICVLTYYNTRILTYKDIRDSVKVWARHDSVKNIHAMVKPLVEILTEAEHLTKEELAIKKSEYAEGILKTWHIEAKANNEAVETILISEKKRIKELQDELELLHEYKAERDGILADSEEELDE